MKPNPPTPSTAPNEGAPEIVLDHVSKQFATGASTSILREGLCLGPEADRFQALDTLNIKVEPGRLLGLLGHNGAGKSTLLRVAAKVYRPSSGVVSLGGDVTAIFELGLGGSSTLTGRQFCRWHFVLMGVPASEQELLVEDVEDFAELGEYFDQPLRTYSSGMRARLFFGAATAIPAPIVLMDEVMCVGDEHFRGKSFRRLHKLVSSGAAGILASHDWQTSLRLCDEIAILDHGRIQFRGSPRQAVQRYVQESLRVSGRACFLEREALLGSPLRFTPGAPFLKDFEVEIREPGPVDFAYAVEAPELGTALILGIEHRIGEDPGRYSVRLEFEEFPVALPECVLSLYLSAPLTAECAGQREIHDTISWTRGSSIQMLRTDVVHEPDGETKTPRNCTSPLVVPGVHWKRKA